VTAAAIDLSATADAVESFAHAAHGTHCLIDCHGVDAQRLRDAASLRAMLRGAAEAAGARILFDHFHDFGGEAAAPGGVTGVVLLAESHATIHTWPDAGFAAIDIFLCGDTDLDRAVAAIERGLSPSRVVVSRTQRGVER
jgi:S-adenosylmethionine decarboxylase